MTVAISGNQFAAQRALEADLISGALELSDLHVCGIPSARVQNFPESPEAILDRLLASVRPWDLSEAAGAAWARLGAVWNKRRRVGWDDLEIGASASVRRVLAYCREYGMGIGLQAPPAAARLLALASARKDLEQTQAEAAKALEERAEALRGVSI